MAAEINNGTVEYTGEERSQGERTPDAAKHVVHDGYVNNGKVTATGKDEEGDGYYGGSGMWVYGGFTNHGEVNAFGGKGLIRPNPVIGDNGGTGGNGILVEGDFKNYHTVTATGGAGFGGHGGNSIVVRDGDVRNFGTVIATGGNGTGTSASHGIAIQIQTRSSSTFINNGEVIATGGNTIAKGDGGSGIFHDAGDFINNGRVTATGGTPTDGVASFSGDGIRIAEGRFINKGDLIARGGIGTEHSHGVNISYYDSNGIEVGFDNKGVLAISGREGGKAALALSGKSRAVFRDGSTLALLAEGRIDVNAANSGTFTNTLTIESSARLISLEALKTDSANKSAKHENFIVNAITGTDVSAYENSTSPLVTVTIERTDVSEGGNKLGENLTATFTRQTDAAGNLLYASDIVSGAAGDYMAALENLVVGNADAIDPDDPRFSYAMLYAATEQQASKEAIEAGARALHGNARRQVDPQSAATAFPSFTTASRLAGSVFSDRLRLAATLPDDATAIGASLSGLSGNAYANLAPAGTRHGAVAWATPFYQRGDLDGSSGRGDLRERMGGVALGGALLRGDWAFGLSAHLLNVDLAGSGGYDADAKGYGLNLGLARRFCLGSLAPWFELSGGYTYYDFEQKRRGVDLRGNRETYRSDPDVHVMNASALLSNTFDFGRFSLTPRIGADYARADMDDYRERGGSTVPRVRTDAYDSFRSVLGATVSVQATPRIRFEARGDYYHEFADTRSRFTARDSLGLISVNARSQDAGRESGRLGAGVHWRPVSRAELGLDYDLHLAKNYVGHRLSAQVKLAF